MLIIFITNKFYEKKEKTFFDILLIMKTEKFSSLFFFTILRI